MKNIFARAKRINNKIKPVDDGLEFDDRRRLRNALIALSALDPGWMAWVERYVPAKMNGTSARIVRMLVERQARRLTMKHYSFLGPDFIQGVIDSDLPFTDTGSLKGYL